MSSPSRFPLASHSRELPALPRAVRLAAAEARIDALLEAERARLQALVLYRIDGDGIDNIDPSDLHCSLSLSDVDEDSSSNGPFTQSSTNSIGSPSLSSMLPSSFLPPPIVIPPIAGTESHAFVSGSPYSQSHMANFQPSSHHGTPTHHQHVPPPYGGYSRPISSGTHSLTGLTIRVPDNRPPAVVPSVPGIGAGSGGTGGASPIRYTTLSRTTSQYNDFGYGVQTAHGFLPLVAAPPPPQVSTSASNGILLSATSPMHRPLRIPGQRVSFNLSNPSQDRTNAGSNGPLFSSNGGSATPRGTAGSWVLYPQSPSTGLDALLTSPKLGISDDAESARSCFSVSVDSSESSYDWSPNDSQVILDGISVISKPEEIDSDLDEEFALDSVANIDSSAEDDGHSDGRWTAPGSTRGSVRLHVHAVPSTLPGVPTAVHNAADVLEFCIVEANWNDLVSLKKNVSDSSLPVHIPPHVSWSFPPFPMEMSQSSTKLPQEGIAISETISAIQTFIFPSGVQSELVSTAVMRLRTAKHTRRRHCVPFTSENGTPLYACCLTVTVSTPCDAIPPSALEALQHHDILVRAAQRIQRVFRIFHNLRKQQRWLTHPTSSMVSHKTGTHRSVSSPAAVTPTGTNGSSRSGVPISGLDSIDSRVSRKRTGSILSIFRRDSNGGTPSAPLALTPISAHNRGTNSTLSGYGDDCEGDDLNGSTQASNSSSTRRASKFHSLLRGKRRSASISTDGSDRYVDNDLVDVISVHSQSSTTPRLNGSGVGIAGASSPISIGSPIRQDSLGSSREGTDDQAAQRELRQPIDPSELLPRVIVSEVAYCLVSPIAEYAFAFTVLEGIADAESEATSRLTSTTTQDLTSSASGVIATSDDNSISDLHSHRTQLLSAVAIFMRNSLSNPSPVLQDLTRNFAISRGLQFGLRNRVLDRFIGRHCLRATSSSTSAPREPTRPGSISMVRRTRTLHPSQTTASDTSPVPGDDLIQTWAELQEHWESGAATPAPHKRIAKKRSYIKRKRPSSKNSRQRLSGTLGSVIQNPPQACRLKVPGYLSTPITLDLALLPTTREWATAVLFTHLSPSIVTTVLAVLLTECSLVVVGDCPGIVTAVTTAVISLLAPLSWEGVFVPLLPDLAREIFGAPVPLILGTTCAPPLSDVSPSTAVLMLGDNAVTATVSMCSSQPLTRRTTASSDDFRTDTPRLSCATEFSTTTPNLVSSVTFNAWFSRLPELPFELPLDGELRRRLAHLHTALAAYLLPKLHFIGPYVATENFMPVSSTNLTSTGDSGFSPRLASSLAGRTQNVNILIHNTVDRELLSPLPRQLIISLRIVLAALKRANCHLHSHSTGIGSLPWQREDISASVRPGEDSVIFAPFRFLEPMRTRLEFADAMVHTQAFVSFVNRVQREDILLQPIRQFIAHWIFFAIMRRRKQQTRQQRNLLLRRTSVTVVPGET